MIIIALLLALILWALLDREGLQSAPGNAAEGLWAAFTNWPMWIEMLMYAAMVGAVKGLEWLFQRVWPPGRK